MLIFSNKIWVLHNDFLQYLAYSDKDKVII